MSKETTEMTRNRTLERRFEVQARMLDESGASVPVIEGLAARYESPTVLSQWQDRGVTYIVRETLCRGAFDACDMSDVIFNYNHTGRVFARNQNGTLNLTPELDGLHMRAVLRSDDPEHMRLHADIANGYIRGMSFRFRIEEEERTVTESECKVMIDYRVQKINLLHDVSAVDIPAYGDTEIAARRKDVESAIRARSADKRDMERAKILALL